MDREIIKTTIPLSPSLINKYCIANSEGDNNVLFEFDISECPLKPAHILGYLSNLKIDFCVTGYGDEFFEEYLKTPFFVGSSPLIYQHKKMLLNQTGRSEILEQQLQLIHSLPLFLVESADVPGPVKNKFVGEDHRDTNKPLEYVGANFAHLVRDPELFLMLIGDKVYDFDNQRYYNYYFDEYIYGGDNLIQFFNDNPDNLLITAIEALLTR